MLCRQFDVMGCIDCASLILGQRRSGLAGNKR
jgi:hypothetical protein